MFRSRHSKSRTKVVFKISISFSNLTIYSNYTTIEIKISYHCKKTTMTITGPNNHDSRIVRHVLRNLRKIQNRSSSSTNVRIQDTTVITNLKTQQTIRVLLLRISLALCYSYKFHLGAKLYVFSVSFPVSLNPNFRKKWPAAKIFEWVFLVYNITLQF